MQNTRLSTLVDRSLEQLSLLLRNPWRRLAVLIISLLGGNFLATTISTIAGQQAEFDVIVAMLLVIGCELVSWLVYRIDRLRSRTTTRPEPRLLLLEILNGVKLGVTYGLFVEAFKLGS